MTLLLVLVAGLLVVGSTGAVHLVANDARDRPDAPPDVVDGLGVVRQRMETMSPPRRQVVAWMAADVDQHLQAIRRARSGSRMVPRRGAARRRTLQLQARSASRLVDDLLELTDPGPADHSSGRALVSTPPFDLAFSCLGPGAGPARDGRPLATDPAR